MADENTQFANRDDITIKNEVATWIIKAEGKILGTYSGVFEFRCFLTPSQHLAAGRERRDLLGKNAILADNDENFYAYALTQLKYRVISAPPFWDSSKKIGEYSGDIPDMEVLSEILDAAISSEVMYKNQLNERKRSAIERAKQAAEKILQQRDKSDEDKTEENTPES